MKVTKQEIVHRLVHRFLRKITAYQGADTFKVCRLARVRFTCEVKRLTEMTCHRNKRGYGNMKKV